MEGRGSKRGHWSIEEDKILMDYISIHGKGRWNRIAKATGLKRCGKSCRLRWMNYLSPNIKKGSFSEEEDDLIIRLHKLLGNRWSLIAGRVPGRTDNQVKNHWNSHLSKGLKDGKITTSKKDFSSLPVPSSQDSSSQAAGEEMEPNACQEDVAQNQLVSEVEPQSGLNGCSSEEETILQQQEQQQQQISTNDQQFPDKSGCSFSSLWVVNNEQSLDDAPSLVELFEGFPLDMMWNQDF